MRLPRPRLRRRPPTITAAKVVVAVVLIVGLTGTYAALRARESDSQFIAAQQNLSPVTALQLSNLLGTSHDARPGHRHAHARSASCVLIGRGASHNPWKCVVRYPAPPAVSYRVVVAPNGSVLGIANGTGLSFRGCCVNPPGNSS